jgi:isopentenyldiphosphate isomerase
MVYRAAESSDGHEDEILNISAERLQKLKDAPESDDDL